MPDPALPPEPPGGGLRALARNPRAVRAAFVLLLLATNVPAYLAGLDRPFAGDQIFYFAEIENDTRLSSGLRHWDFNATRRYNKGDELLFRPLLFSLLAVETTLFDHDYRAWNLLNFALHLGVSFLLFELLWSIRPSIFAAAAALAFSLVTAGLELVLWNHLGGYLLGYALLLAALRSLRTLDSSAASRMVYAAAMLGAMLCHELGVVAALLAAGFWALRRGGPLRPCAAALALPLAIYGILYAVHASRCERLTWIEPGDPAGAALGGPPFVIRVAVSLGTWALKMLNPWSAVFAMKPHHRFWWAEGPAPTASWVALAAGLAGAAAAVRQGLTRENLARHGRFAALLAAVLLAYAAMNNVGRPSAPGVTYYVYFFSLAASVLAYLLVDVDRLSPRAAAAALALLALFSAAQGVRTRAVTRQVAALNAPLNDYFDKVDEFVRAHRDRPGFGFAVVGAGPLDARFPLWKGYVVDRMKPDAVLPVTGLLYPRYYDEDLTRSGSDVAKNRHLLKWDDASQRRR
jgi:hypothetical protein